MKSLLLKISIAFALFFPMMMSSQPAYADCIKPVSNQEAIQCGACGANGQIACGTVDANSKKAATDLGTTIKNVLNLISLFVGVLAVIMVMVGGFRYITSGGKQENVSAAKNTLLYAVIGLAVVALSQAIVHFVLSNISIT
jgi:hypothetical protein